MKLMDLAKKMGRTSTCGIIIRRGVQQLKAPQRASELEQKINNEIIENFTVHYFAVANNELTIFVK